MKFNNLRAAIAAAVLAAGCGAVFAQKGEVVKIAVIDPLSGLAAVTGANQLKTAEFYAEILNRSRGSGPKYEIIGLDSKFNPAEAVLQVKNAIDRGARYISHGNGSAVAAAIIEAVAKHNERNPGKEVIYVNQSAIEPSLTQEKCNYWHFRIDADVSMRMEAIAAFVKDRPDIKKVYLINQNYSFGQQVAKYARERVKDKRPDVEIVGDELIPSQQIRDFTPYIAKIKASGADTIITGNWGTDLSLLAKASVDGGYQGKFITFYAGGAGTPQAFGASGLGRVYVVASGHNNMGGMADLLFQKFKQQYKEDLQSFPVIYSLMLINEAILKAKSTDPVKVAAAMEGLSFEGFNGRLTVRKQDHQTQQAMFLLVMGKTSVKYPNGLENTDYTMIPEKRYEDYVSSTPTTCQMERPARVAASADAAPAAAPAATATRAKAKAS